MGVTFTIDLEDHTERYEPEGRYAEMTRRILDLCAQHNCRATFFTVGRVAEASPRLIYDIAHQGHEIAYHSHAHLPLTEETPDRLRYESKKDKDLLEQLSGKPVKGYRAPRFSLTPKSLWAIYVLGELGFAYSSSIMPTKASLYGFPEASTKPFRWKNGMWEFPLPVAKVGSLRIPYLGGIYLYALPSFLTQHWLKQADKDEVLWTYTHPYDFDRAEKFAPMPHTPLWVSAVLWMARFTADRHIRALLNRDTSAPLVERVPL